MTSRSSAHQATAVRTGDGSAAVTRLAWIFGDRDVLMLLRRPLLAATHLRRHKVLALAPGLTPADQLELSGMGIESAAITLPGSGYNPFTAVSARRRLAQTLQAWRATALIIETGEGMDLAARAAAQAGVAGIFPLLPPLESGAPANPRIAANVSWRHAFSLASAVFVQTPNDARLLAGPLAKLRVPQHQLPAASLDLARLQAQALPTLDLGFVFFGLDCGA